MKPNSPTAQAAPNGYYILEDILALRDSLVHPDEILDAGARGLQFFDRFHDLATRLGFEERVLTSYEDSYRAEAGIDFEPLARDVSDMAGAVDGSVAEIAMLTVLAENLPAVWNISGVDAVVDQAFAARRDARSDADSAPLLIALADELAQTVRRALADKAFKVASLDRATIGGLGAGEIDQLARIASSGRGSAPWLDTVFRSAYLDARDEFDRACAQCASAVGDAFDAATQWVTDAFPSTLPIAETNASGAAAAPISFSIGGNTWGFSIAPDGRGVSLDVAGADGNSVSVTVDLNENGWPRIVFDSVQEAAMQETHPQEASQPATLQPEIPHRDIPQPEVPVETTTEFSPAPDPEPPATVPDESIAVPDGETGAELAGAGPL
ncbi:hypothetical protein QM716_06205 [Rhodococcus sp. IEGM 1409]|uniref:hypothetical protein n=1 Tax=Rhodococcus sp. IEGM 1409 TaxID=3047082 RepID=UPI0024B667C6|nr:hypothetical protein [Rhodococcus sp. IEGM 1409]MDI9899442.1 hypothetical protein [Rhodococcus sp. IEGM 1409]